MTEGTLSQALEREHREIDGGIEDYVAAGATGDPAPLLRAMEALRRHIYLEEEFLFPPLKDAGMTMPVFVMLREHGELWDAMDGIERMLASDASPRERQDTCRGLLAMLDNHNSKEGPVIYPQADAVLAPEATVRLQDIIATGRMPDGWRCEKAG
ncbi:MAG: hemerythrin domain-containing protein [Microbacteriaceae bacterium]|nr:hemerythrin domain-containing protein [Microbacteriaceae bacterium]